VETEDGVLLEPDPVSGRMTHEVTFQGEGRVKKTLHLKPAGG
jgi:hypothetical protein